MRLIVQIFLFLFFASYAWSQYLVSVRAGLINHAEGLVSLDNKPLQFRTDHLQELTKGQYLRTYSGKVELQLGPAASLWMGESGSLQMVNPNITDTRLRIEKGSIFIEIIEKYKKNRISIQLGESVIELKEIGLYRLDSELQHLYVFNGKAEIRRNQKKATVKQGKFSDLDNNLKTSKFDKNQEDSLHTWMTHRSNVLYMRIKRARRMQDRRIHMETRNMMWQAEQLARRQVWEQQRRQQQQQQQQQRNQTQQLTPPR